MFKVGDRVLCVCEKYTSIDNYTDWFADLIKNRIVHTVVNISGAELHIKAESGKILTCRLEQLKLYKPLPKNYKGLVGQND